MNRNILFLYELSRNLKDRNAKVSMSSSQIGEASGISQQSASRYLRELEEDGLIKRTKSARSQDVALTQKGYDALEEMYLNLKALIEVKEKNKAIEGTVVRGLGEGAYYVAEYAREIEKRLGIKPFPGTLNIKMGEEVGSIERLATGTIKGFKREGRTFGSIKYSPVKISSGGRTESCYLIVPVRSHHKGTLEIISDKDLRKKMSLSDGDHVTVEFPA